MNEAKRMRIEVKKIIKKFKPNMEIQPGQNLKTI